MPASGSREEEEVSQDTTSRDEARPTRLLALISAIGGNRRRALAAIAIVAFIGALAEAGVLLLLAKLALTIAQGETHVDASLGPLGDVSVSVPELVASAAVLTVLRVALQFGQAALTTRTFADVWSDVRARLLALFVGASWAVQSRERDGRLQELATTYATAAANAVLSLSQVVVAALSLVAFLATALAVNVLAALVVIVAAGAVALLLRPIRHTIRSRSRATSEANLALATDITEFAANMQEVRVFGVERPVLTDVTARIRAAGKLEQRSQFIRAVAPALYQGLALLLVVGAVGMVYAAGETHLSSLSGIVLVMVRSVSYGQQLQSNYQGLHTAAPFFERLLAEQQRYESSAVHRDGQHIESIGAIRFQDVTYEYEAGRPVLHEVSFALRQGEIVGIVGPSGSGKSTLVQLLLRLRVPTAGSIFVAERDVESLALDDWYQRVSFVPQEPRFFAGTVAENIRFFRSGIDDAAVQRAAEHAHLHDDISSWPLQYDTPIGERGSQLSGGQRQRLSIAHALAKEPDVLVLDEPTSSLDVRSEALIRQTLRDLGSNTTVVVIAHRLSTLDVCHRIMVVKDGRIEGFDAPDRLEATDPFYREALHLSGLR